MVLVLGGQDLNIQSGVILWATYPVQLTAVQQETINTAVLRSIMNDNALSPSKAAGLNKNVTPLINVLDKEFREAVLKYKLDLAESEGMDRLTIDKLKSYRDAKYSGCKGFFRIIGHWLCSSYVSEAKMKADGSVHRHAWMIRVCDRENERMKGIRKKIENAIKAKLIDIAALQAGQTDIDRLKELHQLSAVFKALFPNVNQADVEAARKVLASSSVSMSLLT